MVGVLRVVEPLARAFQALLHSSQDGCWNPPFNAGECKQLTEAHQTLVAGARVFNFLHVFFFFFLVGVLEDRLERAFTTRLLADLHVRALQSCPENASSHEIEPTQPQAGLHRTASPDLRLPTSLLVRIPDTYR